MSLRHSDDPFRMNEPGAIGHRTYAERSFSYMAPRLYNKLPIDLKSVNSVELFQSKLKTYIFHLCYDLNTGELRPEYKL